MADTGQSSQIIIEGGLLFPLGDLGAELDKASQGLGAKTGYEIGFRLSLPVTSVFSVSPGFHFADFKSHIFADDAEQEYKTEALCYRFSIEGMLKKSTGGWKIQPFLAVAAGLYRDRVVGYYDDPTAEKQNASINSLGYSVRLGLAFHNFELSSVMNYNRVETWHFFKTGIKEDYNWDHWGLRLGFFLPW